MSTLAAALTSLGTVAIILGITACLTALIVGTDPETWRATDRVVDYAPEGQSWPPPSR